MEEKTFNCVQWLQKYKKDIDEIREKSPFLSMVCINCGIEFLGKLLSADNIDANKDCQKKYENALSNFKSLNKYANKDFYNLIRCGMLHRTSVKDGIILIRDGETELNQVPIKLNVNDFFDDFSKAVEDAQKREEWNNSAATQHYVTIRNDEMTGTTQTIIDNVV